MQPTESGPKQQQQTDRRTAPPAQTVHDSSPHLVAGYACRLYPQTATRLSKMQSKADDSEPNQKQQTDRATAPPADTTRDSPSHLVVLVNGLWGWQKDWKMTKRYFDDANKNNRLLVHISNANTGPLTYEGIDTCGARLAQEIHSLTLSSPTLSHISLIGHSMGGLIARYALGLLTNPDTGKVAGLNPVCFVSVASPHIGCSSDHPAEVEWQDRPWMRLLSHAVRSGHLGTLPDPHAAADSTAAAEAVTPTHKQQHASAGNADEQKKKDSHSSSGGGSSKKKVWPWKMRSVIQLLGCDSWRGSAPMAAATAAAAAECKDTTGSGSSSNDKDDASGQGKQQSVSCCSCAAREGSSKLGSSSSGSGGCAVCGSKDPQQQQQHDLAPAAAAAAAAGGQTALYSNRCSSCGGSGCLLVTDSQASSSGSSSGGSGSSSGGGSGSTSSRPLLDYMTQDVRLSCSHCGTVSNCYFLTGLKLFKFRWTYSSTGGDHLIPWSSSSLLFPHQLPKPRPAGPLPAAAWWGTPHIVEWPPDTLDKQQQQQQQQSGGQQQQEQRDLEEQFNPDDQITDPTARSADLADSRSELGPDPRSDLRSAESSGGVLTQRLRALQSVGPWRHYHVVWPKICLGSSHCNIQYNGAVNFVGRAVVEHLVNSVVRSSTES